jgi:hypothetical protein
MCPPNPCASAHSILPKVEDINASFTLVVHRTNLIPTFIMSAPPNKFFYHFSGYHVASNNGFIWKRCSYFFHKIYKMFRITIGYINADKIYFGNLPIICLIFLRLHYVPELMAMY